MMLLQRVSESESESIELCRTETAATLCDPPDLAHSDWLVSHGSIDEDDVGSNHASEDEHFEDALEVLGSAPPVAPGIDRIDVVQSTGYQPLWRCVCHSINSILTTLGMVVALVFAYFQYQQQAWSNRISALQTCLALEQAAEFAASSTYCNKTLHQDIHGFGARSVEHKNFNKAEVFSSSTLVWSGVIALMTIVGVFTLILVWIIRDRYRALVSLQGSEYSSPNPRHSEWFATSVHVANEIPRKSVTGTEIPSTTKLRHTYVVDEDNTEECRNYLEAQSVLKKKMQLWVRAGDESSIRKQSDHEAVTDDWPDQSPLVEQRPTPRSPKHLEHLVGVIGVVFPPSTILWRICSPPREESVSGKCWREEKRLRRERHRLIHMDPANDATAFSKTELQRRNVQARPTRPNTKDRKSTLKARMRIVKVSQKN